MVMWGIVITWRPSSSVIIIHKHIHFDFLKTLSQLKTNLVGMFIGFHRKFFLLLIGSKQKKQEAQTCQTNGGDCFYSSPLKPHGHLGPNLVGIFIG
jgi:hypothetical protein